MGLRINTNLPSLVAQRNLRANRLSLDQSLERLSSGSRINNAGDDAAGLAVSESLRAQISGMNQSERNIQDGISVIQIAEGALSEISNILIRLRELGVQSSSDTVGSQERKYIDIEYQHVLDEIDRISHSTSFNGVPLLAGNKNAFEIQIGAGNNPAIDRVNLFDPLSSDINLVSLGINVSSVSDKLSAQNSLETVDQAIKNVNSLRSEFGAIQNRLNSSLNNLMINRENLTSANSRIHDSDIAKEATELTKNNILMESGISVLTQANSSLKSALNLLGGA